MRGRAGFEAAVPIPGRRACLVPFVIESRKGLFQDEDPYTRGGYAPRSRVTPMASIAHPGGGGLPASVRWHNAVVADLDSGARHVLLDGRGVISQCRWLGPADERGLLTRTDFLLLTVSRDDSNGDGAINDLDAHEMLLVPADGWSPRPVTPAGTQAWEVRFDEPSGLVYFQIVPDSNGDRRFTDADSPEAWVLDPARDESARPLVDAALRDRLEIMAR